MFVGAQINNYGVAAAAVNGAASKLENILRIVCNSMSTAGCTMVAQNMGAGRTDRVRRVIFDILAVCVVYTAVCALLLWLFPTQIFSLFNREPEVLAYAVVYALPGVVTYLGHGVRAAFSTVYNGVGNAGLSLFAGLLDGVVARIGLAMLFGNVMGMGLQGFWYGSALAGYVAAIIGGIYFFSGRWERYRLLH
jgi:Na+-driven multidrug efflux pump